MEGKSKIFLLDDLAKKTQELKQKKSRIVLCHGVFDLLHIGHIRYFEQAKSFGDTLIVTLTPDQFVDKGPHRPAFPENLRAEAVASLDCVDFVAINKWETAEETLRLLLPDYYVKGSEFKHTSSDRTGKIGKELSIAKELGISFKYTEDIVFSSSNLINRHLSVFSDEIDSYLSLLRSRYSLDEILEILDKTTDLKVLVIGDTILDEYQYCDAIGKSSKDPTLALKYQSHDLFAGGVLAVANHVANFASSVQLVTFIGDQDSRELFIRKQLHPKVTPHLLVQEDSPTTIKRRFVDGYSFNKLLEIYVMNDSGPKEPTEQAACSLIQEIAADCDLVIAADFGHGAISEKMRETIIQSAPFLAVNTQANAGNRGFHTISRYRKADYCCIAEHELHLETRTKGGDLRKNMEILCNRLGCQYFTVTLGRKGCAIYGFNDSYVKIPSFTRKVVDRVGAGDAFFAVTSLTAVHKSPVELIGFIGNIVGSLAVEVIGNKKAINKQSTEKFITSILK